MRIYKYKRFADWAKSENVIDEILRQAVTEISQGLYDANLGAGLYKKRIAKNNRGKSGSYRTLISLKLHDKAIFIYGYTKNEQANTDSKEIEIFKKLSKHYLNLSEDQINILINKGELFEVAL